VIQSTQQPSDARIQREEVTPSGKNFSTKKVKQHHVTKFFTGKSTQGAEITSRLKNIRWQCTLSNTGTLLDERCRVMDHRSRHYCKPQRKARWRFCYPCCWEAGYWHSSLGAKAGAFFENWDINGLSVLDWNLGNELPACALGITICQYLLKKRRVPYWSNACYRNQENPNTPLLTSCSQITSYGYFTSMIIEQRDLLFGMTLIKLSDRHISGKNYVYNLFQWDWCL
jgi:hypothetical protein